MAAGAIDVWMQHPTVRHSQHEMFDALRRCMGVEAPTEAVPLELTIAVMDEGGVETGLTASWHGPAGDLISNDEVAKYVQQYPDRLRGVAGADLRRPMDAVRDLRRRVEEGLVAVRIVPWLWELPPTDRG